MLTSEQFEEIPHGETFREVIGIFPDISATKIHAIAKKGQVSDWVIYYLPVNHFKFTGEVIFNDGGFSKIVERSGQKITWESNIRDIVPCTDEVYKLYRF
jgi:hypothetical protein